MQEEALARAQQALRRSDLALSANTFPTSHAHRLRTCAGGFSFAIGNDSHSRRGPYDSRHAATGPWAIATPERARRDHPVERLYRYVSEEGVQNRSFEIPSLTGVRGANYTRTYEVGFRISATLARSGWRPSLATTSRATLLYRQRQPANWRVRPRSLRRPARAAPHDRPQIPHHLTFRGFELPRGSA